MSMILIPNEVLTVVVNNIPYNVAAAHPNFNKCVEAAKAGRFSDIPGLVDIPTAIAKFSAGHLNVDVRAQVITYDGKAIHNYACTKIFELMEHGFDIKPLVNFLENLYQNPSKKAIDELYQFLEVGKMPITADGHFIAYKRVRSDFKSVHDGRTDNSVGSIVEMPRHEVDDRSENTCSNGLHFCSLSYLSSYGGDKIVLLKINPRDVVSIPKDYDDTKGRACRYEVLDVLSDGDYRRAVEGTHTFEKPVVEEPKHREPLTSRQKDIFEVVKKALLCSLNIGVTEDDLDTSLDALIANDDWVLLEVATIVEEDFDLSGDEMLSADTPRDIVLFYDSIIANDRATKVEEVITATQQQNQQFITGYCDGYEDGRHKRTPYNSQGCADPFVNGYDQGYKDGRGHKSRKYVKPS